MTLHPTDMFLRIEDADGVGPYRSATLSTSGFEDLDGANPTPYRDHLKTDRSKTLGDVRTSLDDDAIFGFSTVGQMKRWFNDREIIEEEKWEEHGFHIAVYPKTELKEVFEATHQAIATKDFGTSVPKALLPLSKLYEPTDTLRRDAIKALRKEMRNH